MKRVQLEPWSTQEKLCLVSAIHKTGDQNWTAVSRATKNLFEETVNREPSPEVRPPEWFSMKQCAAQYENLLKTVATPRRKKRTEKGSEVSETPIEIIAGVLRLEFTEELKASINEDYAVYMKLKKEKEDAEAGLLDDKLEDLIAEYEAKDREKEIKKKLKYKLGEKLSAEEMLKPPDVEPPLTPTHEPEVKPSSATSPLLTSLLQSPSPLTRPSMPSNASPTISLLLNSSPAVPASESPTLSKLLESPTSITGPIPQPLPLSLDSPVKLVPSTPPPAVVSSPVKQDPPVPIPSTPPKVSTPPPMRKPPTPPPAPKPEPEEPPKQEIEAEESVIKIEKEETPDVKEVSHEAITEMVLDEELKEEKKKEEITPMDIEVEDMEPGDEVLETVEELIEKVEEVVAVTRGASETSEDEAAPEEINPAIVPEAPEQNVGNLDLDQETVELIVVGPNEAPPAVSAPQEASETPVDTIKTEDEVKEETNDGPGEDVQVKQEEETPKIEVKDEKEELVEESENLDEVTLKSTESKDETSSKISDEDGESKPEPEATEDYKTSPEGPPTEEAEEDEDEEVSEEADETPREDFSESSKDKPEQTDETMDSSEVDEVKTEKAEESSEEREVVRDKKRKLSARSEDEDEPSFLTKGIKDTAESPSPKSQKDEMESTRRTILPQTRQEKPSTSEATSTTSQDQIPKSPKAIGSSKEDKKEETERRRGTRKRFSILSQSDSKPSSPASSLDEDKDYKMWKKSMLLEYNRLASHKYASAFSKPIREADAVGYHSVIKRPMDLSTIKKNIESGAIRTTVEFQRDLLLMVQNAIMYNKTSTLVYKMAQDMLVDIIAQLQIMVDAIGDGVPLATHDRQPARGRASKVAAEESWKRKRSSIGDIEATRQSKRKKTDSSGST